MLMNKEQALAAGFFELLPETVDLIKEGDTVEIVNLTWSDAGEVEETMVGSIEHSVYDITLYGEYDRWHVYTKPEDREGSLMVKVIASCQSEEDAIQEAIQALPLDPANNAAETHRVLSRLVKSVSSRVKYEQIDWNSSSRYC